MGNEDFEVSNMYKLIYLCVFSLNNIEDKEQKIGSNGETVNDYIKIIKDYHLNEQVDEPLFEFISENDFAREHVKVLTNARDSNIIKTVNTSEKVIVNKIIRNIQIFIVKTNSFTFYKFGHSSVMNKVYIKTKKVLNDSELTNVTKSIVYKIFPVT